jgi:adenine specific DNA methylase Mod
MFPLLSQGSEILLKHFIESATNMLDTILAYFDAQDDNLADWS